MKCDRVAREHCWNAINMPDILCMLVSKLPNGLTDRCNRARIMNFAPFNRHTTPLFSIILKFADIVNVESCIFINNFFSDASFSVFNKNFKLVLIAHSYNTNSARNGLLFIPGYNSVRFGRKLSIQPLLHGIIFKTS